MLVEIYDALREAGASEEKARRAAEALTGYDERFGRIELRITELRGEFAELRGEFAEMRGEFGEFRGETQGRFRAIEARLTMLQWVISIMAAAEVAILVKLFVR